MPGGDDQYDLELANEAEELAEAYQYLHDSVYEATRNWLQRQPQNFPQTFKAFWNRMREDNGMS